jgi:hypothetical protein
LCSFGVDPTMVIVADGEGLVVFGIDAGPDCSGAVDWVRTYQVSAEQLES